MTKKEKVSIVIPVYNAEATIEKCLLSIVNQNYKNIQIIVINDGSIDRSEQIIKKIKDPRIIYKKIKNSGVSSARNIGILLSEGNYIMFIDSDDYISNDYISSMIKYKENFVICDFLEFNEKNKIIKRYHNENIEEKNILQDFTYLLIDKEAINRPWGKLYNTKIIKKYNIFFDNNMSLGEDLIFNLEYLEHIKKITFIDRGLYFYRVGNPYSLGKRYYSNMLEIQEKLKNKLLSFSKKNRLSEEDMKRVYYKGLHFLMSSVSNELRGKEKNKLHKMKKMMETPLIQEYALEMFRKGYLKKSQLEIIKQKRVIIYFLFRKIIFKGVI